MFGITFSRTIDCNLPKSFIVLSLIFIWLSRLNIVFATNNLFLAKHSLIVFIWFLKVSLSDPISISLSVFCFSTRERFVSITGLFSIEGNIVSIFVFILLSLLAIFFALDDRTGFSFTISLLRPSVKTTGCCAEERALILLGFDNFSLIEPVFDFSVLRRICIVNEYK